MSWKKGLNSNTFIHELKICIRNLYSIGDVETINALAVNHVVNNLEDALIKEAKIFQLINSGGT